jgi:hypothetical protein
MAMHRMAMHRMAMHRMAMHRMAMHRMQRAMQRAIRDGMKRIMRTMSEMQTVIRMEIITTTVFNMLMTYTTINMNPLNMRLHQWPRPLQICIDGYTV